MKVNNTHDTGIFENSSNNLSYRIDEKLVLDNQTTVAYNVQTPVIAVFVCFLNCVIARHKRKLITCSYMYCHTVFEMI